MGGKISDTHGDIILMLRNLIWIPKWDSQSLHFLCHRLGKDPYRTEFLVSLFAPQYPHFVSLPGAV